MTPAPVIRVLNVEDYAPARYARSKILREAGFEVTEAETGHEALAIVAAKSPHLVLLDVNLPDLSGCEVCRRIKSDPRTALVQVLHVSAASRDGDDYVHALEQGADGYLTEPIEPRVLVATVRALVRARRAEEAVQVMSVELLAAEQAARASAEAANRAKDEFLAVLSHELRTPLTAILGWVGMLTSRRLDAEATQRAFEVVARNARLQVQLVDQLLDVSRMISGKMSLALDAIDLVRVVEASIDALRGAAADKSIEVSLSVEGDQVLVNGDPGRLQQVFTNVLGNAVKFTPEGGQVSVGVAFGEQSVRIVVRDTGQGIDPAFLPSLFEPFRQSEAAGRRAHLGLGLGLALSRHLVELHGGTIAAASAGLGHGATITVTLPATLAASAAPAVPPGAAVRTPPVTDEPLSGVRIVLAEDEPDTRDALALMLSHAGADVVAVDTARGALDAITAHPPDLLISDIGMPEQDGYDLIRAVRRLEPERGGATPAIAVTAFARETDQQKALSAGYDGHLAKPVEGDALTSTVVQVLRAGLPRDLGREPV